MSDDDMILAGYVVLCCLIGALLTVVITRLFA